jgi:plastocyanin
MVGSSVHLIHRVWGVLWGVFFVWPIGAVPAIAYATDLTERNEAVSATSPVVVGRVSYRGSVPTPIEVQVDRDNEVCGQVATVATLSVDASTHGVRDVIVYIDSGQGVVDHGPVQVSILQNKRCVFYPRVAPLRVGAEVEIRNDDPVMHNTHVSLYNGTVLNVALVPGGAPIKKPLKKEGLHLIKCNVHKFMQAYRYIFRDPYFDQTNETGQFRIQGLSPGLHTVSAWHETLGVLQKEIQVPVRGTVSVDFEFK